MKALKIVAGILVILLLVPALLPREFEVKRSIEIADSQENVFSYLVNLELWQEWSPWLAAEPEAQVEFGGVPGVVGSYQEWNGKVVGSGRQTLSAVQQPDSMEFELEFTEPASAPATSSMKITPKNEGVEVTWAMQGSLSYPFGRVFGLLMPQFIGKKFEEGLENLKSKLEPSMETQEEPTQ